MADGLLAQGLNFIDQQKQALAARLGLLANNPQEFAKLLAGEAQQRAGVGLLGEPKTAKEMASGSWINSPYGQQAMQAGSGFAGTISPFGKGIVNEKIGNSTISYQLGDDNILKIFSLRTPQTKRGQGSATAAMEEIVSKADQYKIPITLDASPLDKKTRLNSLVDFYRKFGFEPTGEKVNAIGEPVMFRNPK